jgi:hypothetical protein
MEVFMLRKVSLVAIAAVIVAGTTFAIPANAATKISNGVACTKINATVESGGYTYKCARNLLIKNSKLTWLSADCISLSKAWAASKANLPKIKATSDTPLAGLDADIVVQQTAADKATSLIAEYQGKITTIKAALVTLKADTVNLTKNKATIDKYEGAIKSYEAAIKGQSTVGRQLDRTKSARALAQNTYSNAQSEVNSGYQMAKLICTKGY